MHGDRGPNAGCKLDSAQGLALAQPGVIYLVGRSHLWSDQ